MTDDPSKLLEADFESWKPEDRNPSTCYDRLKYCKYEGWLSMMPDVLWCKKYGKRFILDWPFPKRLPECEATVDWFSEWKTMIEYREI